MKKSILLFLLILLYVASPALGQQVIGVHGLALPPPPVISNATPGLMLPATANEAVNTMTATNSPTSWSLSSCSPSCTGYFALNASTGAVTVTPTGVSGITAGTYTLTVTASNAYGASNPGTDTITASTAPPAYYVSTTGSDFNNGTSPSTAFATFGKAQTAMQGGSIKTTYLEPGTLTPSSILTLTSADNGETWAGDPNNASYNSAVINMQNNYEEAIWINGGSNITIGPRLKVENTIYNGVCIHGGSVQPPAGSGGLNCNNYSVAAASNNTVTGIEVTGETGTSLPQAWQDGISAWGDVPNTTISHNYVHDVPGGGIEVRAYGNSDYTISGSLVTGNAILNVMQNENDDGCVYMEDLEATSSGWVVSNNFCRDWHGQAGGDGQGSHCIYLDASTSNGLIDNNICGSPGNSAIAGTSFFELGCGFNNTFRNNILDLGTVSYVFVMQYVTGGGAPNNPCTSMTGNVLTGNIIISNYAGGMTNNWDGQGSKSYIEAGPPPTPLAISHNMYYNYGGGTPNTTGVQSSDTSPVIADPSFAAGTLYALKGGSPAYNAIGSGGIGFTAIPGGWGPPGFVMPTSSTAPVSY